MSRLRLNKGVTPTTPPANKGELFYSSTLDPDGLAWIDEAGTITRLSGLAAGIPLSGTGSPEGAVTAPIGVVYHQTDGANGTVVWFKNSGSGNTGWRPLQSSLGIINGTDYGTVGDGVTDDTAALLAAITAAGTAGKKLVLPAGRYLINTSLSYQADVDVISIEGQGEVVLDGSASTTQQLIALGGTLGSAVALGASPSKGDVVINAPLTGVAKGDLLYLVSTDSFSGASAFFVKGEMVEVESVSGDNYTLRTALYDSYDMATTTVAKMNAPQVQLQNITVLRNSNHEGLQIQYARDIYLRNVRVSGARYSSLDLWQCVSGVVENCGSDDAWYTGSGNSYGLAVNSCQWITVLGGTWYGGRHALATGGTTPVRGMSYLGVTAMHDVVDDPTTGSFDFHDNTEYTVVRDCNLYGSLVGQFRNLMVVNNRFYSVTGQATVQGDFYTSSDYFIFRGNTTESPKTSFAIRVAWTNTNAALGLVDISDNTANSSSGISVDDDLFAGAAITKLRLNGNTVVSTGTGSNQFAFVLGGAGSTLVVDDAEVIGGYYEAAAAVPFTYRPHVDSRTARFLGVTFKSTGTFRPFNIYNLEWAEIAGCRIEADGGATQAATNDVAVTVLRDNYFLNCGANGGFLAIISVLSAAVAQITGNTQDGCTGTMGASGGVIIIDYVDYDGRRIGRGTAAPASGTWKVGDIVWKTNPAATGPLGFLCSAAGTPGTWQNIGIGDAPLASPVFTGNPTAPTATANDNSTKLATTAYVDRATTHTGTTSAAPTGTTSTTAVMMGLAGSITPTRGTKIVVMISGQMENSVVNDGVIVDLRFGTGTAPANGDAVTGTLVGISQQHTALVAADRSGFCVMGKVTGLTVDVAYWLDLSVCAVVGGTASVTGVSVVAYEVP